MTSVNRRRDIVDILGFDVAGKLSDDIVKNTAMASNTVMAYSFSTICRKDKSKVSNTARQFVKFMRCLRYKYSAKKTITDDDRNMKLKTEDYYMYRGTSSNYLNSIQDTSESGETITWYHSF
jgi:hypothetical protein